MKVYNTLTRQKEEFIPLKKGEYSIYVCGPTVYNFIHIGNARPIVVFDVLRRYLEYLGNKVVFVSNITDIDDKLIAKAAQENTTMQELAKKYENEYFVDLDGLGSKRANAYPRATEHIDEIIKLIQKIIEKGYAYIAKNNDVYFCAKKFEGYGKLSHLILDELESGNRELRSNLQDDLKKDSADFAIWKASKEGEPYWDSPFGKGRPGWHIECSAMVKKHFGNTIDMHCGGEDLIFPHHENEIAQSECANGCEFARYWMHNGFLNIDNKKMSKSKNNFFTVRDIAQKYGYESLRYFLLTGHYRGPLNYTPELLDSCTAALERLYTCKENLLFALQNTSEEKTSNELDKKCENAKTKFCEAMDDDLNTVNALAAIFDFVRDINTLSNSSSKASLENALNVFLELTGVLGIVQEEKKDDIPQDVYDLVEQRTQAKQEKNWQKADEIRDKLSSMGYVVEDTKQGAKIVKK